MTACLQIDVPVTFDVDDCCSMANQSLLPLASYADEWCAGSGSSWSDTVTPTSSLDLDSRSRVLGCLGSSHLGRPPLRLRCTGRSNKAVRYVGSRGSSPCPCDWPTAAHAAMYMYIHMYAALTPLAGWRRQNRATFRRFGGANHRRPPADIRCQIPCT